MVQQASSALFFFLFSLLAEVVVVVFCPPPLKTKHRRSRVCPSSLHPAPPQFKNIEKREDATEHPSPSLLNSSSLQYSQVFFLSFLPPPPSSLFLLGLKRGSSREVDPVESHRAQQTFRKLVALSSFQQNSDRDLQVPQSSLHQPHNMSGAP